MTTKFRQHDRGDEIFSGSLDDIPALCFRDDIKGKDDTDSCICTAYTVGHQLYQHENQL